MFSCFTDFILIWLLFLSRNHLVSYVLISLASLQLVQVPSTKPAIATHTSYYDFAYKIADLLHTKSPSKLELTIKMQTWSPIIQTLKTIDRSKGWSTLRQSRFNYKRRTERSINCPQRCTCRRVQKYIIKLINLCKNFGRNAPLSEDSCPTVFLS